MRLIRPFAFVLNEGVKKAAIVLIAAKVLHYSA